jgi:RNA polymerase sigma-70 factor (ECF subfamily)
MPAIETAFEQIFSQHWAPICSHCFRFVGDRDEAEDLTLEAFWKLYKKGIWRTESDTRIRNWLYRVATNDSLNAIRGRKRRQQYELEAGLGYIRSTSVGNPVTESERRAERVLIRRVLSRMKKQYASVLSLRYAGLSYREIAQAIRISPNSVGTMLARAEKEFMQLYLELEGR